MAKSLREMARERTVFSALAQGKRKIETEDLISPTNKDDEITEYRIFNLREVDLVKNNSDGEVYAVCVVEEMPDCFFFGGLVISDMVTDFMQELGEEEFKNLLKAEGIPLVLTKQKAKKANKDGKINTYVKVTIPDDEIIENNKGGKK